LEDGWVIVEYIVLAAVSAGVLAYELLLVRILSFHYWSCFASMIVSLAMLGFAASGTALFVFAGKKNGSRPVMSGWLLIAFSVSLPACSRISEEIHCMPLTVLWDVRQMALFAAHYLVLSLPFFLGGFIIGHHFLRRDMPAGRVYFWNMLGSGAGVGGALLLLNVVSPSRGLHMIPLPILAVAALRYRGLVYRSVCIGVTAVVLLFMSKIPSLQHMSEYKGLSRALLMPDARVESSAWSPFGHTCVVGSRYIRYAPGLSLTFPDVIPAQKAIFTDGDGISAVCATGDRATVESFFDSMLAGLPYHLFSGPRVLVVGAGGGMEVLNAVIHGASRVDALERDPNIVGLMMGPLDVFSGHLYTRDNVRLLLEDGRSFCSRTRERYDLIILPAGGSSFASATGTSAQDTDYRMTQEGLCDFLSILTPGGALVIGTWLNVPPRNGMKVFATAVAALRKKGIAPRDSLLFARSLRTCLMMVFRGSIEHRQIAAAEDFCRRRCFDRVFHPGIEAAEANRFNRIEGAPHFNMCREILCGDGTPAFRRHIFDIRPARDDRPYFSHFFKWTALPELLRKTKGNLAVHVGWGYMFLIITLLQAVPLGALLILVPLVVLGRTVRTPSSFRWRVYIYFSAIGLGFMFLEMAVIQQFARFMKHPIYAFGTALGIILVGSGLGALVSSRWRVCPGAVFVSIVCLGVVHIALWLVSILLRSTSLFHADMLVVAVMAFFMGFPFPSAIGQVREREPSLVPWAWGINGFVSVLAVLLAGLISISAGLAVVCGIGVLCYLLAAVFFVPAWAATSRESES